MPDSENTTPSRWNKSLATNLTAGGCVLLGAALPEPFHRHVQTMGLFALSGAATNWIAIHMLFEKVPGFYGSGVIPLHFEEFKSAIHKMMMAQFFTRENVERLFKDESGTVQPLDFGPIIDETDLSPAFDALVTAVSESQLGAMLKMFGGASALEPLREPLINRMRGAVKDIAGSKAFQSTVQKKLAAPSVTEDILGKVSRIVLARLDELTPDMVKEIIEQMIHEHLGWLVVWGGVFGGAIGLVASFLV